MRCRRCNSGRLLKLEVIQAGDNPVVRCRECGFLFSPGNAGAGPSSAPGRLGASPGRTGRVG